jgi:hypothetical protein
MKPTLDQLHTALVQSWASDTAVLMPAGHELFAANEPAMGQCAVTSLIVQDYFGGDILNTVASVPVRPDIKSSHYFNVINDEIIDLTRRQFQENVVFSEAKPKTEGFSSTREYILSYGSTAERYEKLKAKVHSLLTA